MNIAYTTREAIAIEYTVQEGEHTFEHFSEDVFIEDWLWKDEQ